MKNNIVLIGMPGVGKSSAGVVLAKAMGYHFVDSDIVIQHKEGRLLSDIIEECGNDGFLKIEDRINSELEPDKKIHDITKQERMTLVKLIKNLTLTLTGLRGFNEAIITQGGVSVKQINPTTMESKLVKNVYFVGEVIDVDAVTGGFNLQIAWSTAYAAGTHLN